MDAVDLNFIREFQLSTIHLPVPEEFLDRVIAESAKLPTHVWQQLAAGFLVAPGEETLGAIACRTLVMGGEADQIFLIDEQRALARRIPGARLHLFPGAGHAPHWEIPDEFAEHLVQFFEGA
jgi:pimeloyl-ACP methyl ester carboxylesterase